MSAPGEFGRVAVLMGGDSPERDVSLRSGAAVLAALLGAGVDAHGIDVGADVLERLAGGRYARAWVALHGAGGEDGTLQGALETGGIPYTGSGVLGSALAMDKLRTKQLWQAVGVSTAPFRVARVAADLAPIATELGFPVFVKPNSAGSSIGVNRADDAAALQLAFAEALQVDREVLVEQFIEGQEMTAAVLQGRALPLIRLETPRNFYDYVAKYEADSTRYHCPCGLAGPLESELQAEALRAFSALACSGWGRVDFILDAQQRPYFLEVNTIPGMTDHSLVPMAAQAAGIDFAALVVRILETSRGEMPS
ncbi:MAG: D-alanine--D-alanine ligase [Gammaproteobacteria bacterium]|nr:D-alanine--D-alanine ligase [Gammaproteobacteria bacterium]